MPGVSSHHMDDLSALRAEVARMRRAATRKVSRLKTVRGVRVSGSEFDPRRPPSLPNRYTAQQLSAYRDKLASFLSRENQYVPDAGQRPIPRAEWQTYKKREAAYKAKAGEIYDRVKNEKLPSGETVAERLAKMDVMHKQMHNPVTNPLFDPHTREPQDVASRAAMKKLVNDLKKKSSPNYMKIKAQQARDQSAAMMSVVASPELSKAVGKLTPGQFTALWNYTTFAAALALSYSSAQKLLSKKDESWADERLRQQMSDAMEKVEWAKKLNL